MRPDAGYKDEKQTNATGFYLSHRLTSVTEPCSGAHSAPTSWPATWLGPPSFPPVGWPVARISTHAALCYYFRRHCGRSIYGAIYSSRTRESARDVPLCLISEPFDDKNSSSSIGDSWNCRTGQWRTGHWRTEN